MKMKHDSVCDAYKILKHSIDACGELSMEMLLDFEALMPHKWLAKILKNREEFFQMYPEKKAELIEKMKSDWMIQDLATKKD